MRLARHRPTYIHATDLHTYMPQTYIHAYRHATDLDTDMPQTYIQTCHRPTYRHATDLDTGTDIVVVISKT
jgi:hypothetical protein